MPPPDSAPYAGFELPSLTFRTSASMTARLLTPLCFEPLRNTIFQSTRPMRGATSLDSCGSSCRRYFNPRAPCGARREGRTYTRRRCHFNPRAPCGARLAVRVVDGVVVGFQSTRPMRGATSFRHKCHPGAAFQSTRPMRGATVGAVYFFIGC